MRLPPLSPSHLIVVAESHVGYGEDHPGRSRGRLVHGWLTQVGIAEGAARDMAWDTAFVHHVGYWSHFDRRCLRSSWPLPLSASRAELAKFAEEEGVLAEHPMAGDLFLLWCPAKKRFVRTGIVVQIEGRGFHLNQAPWYECTTIEGDTNRWRAARGGRTLLQHRVLSADHHDRFVRWTALEPGEMGATRVDIATAEETLAFPSDEHLRHIYMDEIGMFEEDDDERKAA